MNTFFKSTLTAFTLFIVSHTSIIAQDIVDINLDVKHSVGGVSELDRSKYLMVHAGINDSEWPSDEYQREFLEDFDTYLGRNNGSLPWNLSICEEDPDKPGWPSISYLQSKGATAITNYINNTSQHKYENRISRYMIGGQEGMYPNGENEIGPNGAKWTMAKEGYAPLAEFFANYFKYFHGNGGTTGEPLPTYIEVMNEPFVKANSLGTTRENLSEMYRVVSERIKELNPTAKVGGYSAAHPAYEASDFQHWENNWKTFIDIAGEEMDFFSLHLYDNVQKQDEGQYRAGSNVEAILDMVEHYEYLKLGEVKPFCLSEYGCLNTEGELYTKERDWHNLRSFSTMIMQFLERPDVIDQALPFILLKANWWSPSGTQDPDAKYAHRLFRQKKELEGETGDEWVYTEIVKFYQLWANVNGTRVDTKASNLDTQIDTYVNDNKAYVIINNMHHEARTVDLSLKGLGDATIESILIKHLHAENNGVPALDESTITTPIDRINIGREATIILEYTFDKNIAIGETSNETKYFADTYLKPITANQEINFNINGVTTSTNGEAILRLGVGRDHGKSLNPTIKINNTEIEVPTNWRGNDQHGRDEFFGVLEIEFPYNLLQTNNAISINFPDTGGHVSSLTLQAFSFSKNIERSEEVVKIGSDNFSIQTIGETCNNQNNGMVTIATNQNLNYTATIKDLSLSKTFNQNASFENLAPGEHELCITLTEIPDYKQCFTVIIPEVAALKVSSKVNETAKSINLNLEGSETYYITINNKAYTSTNAFIELPLINGSNSIEIKAEKECQGVYKKQIYIGSEIIAYPNPIKDNFTIDLGIDQSKTAIVNLISNLGTLVFSKKYDVSNGKIELNTSNLTNGIYILSVETLQTSKNIKIIKQ
ncbi:T9SS type A sorting domain-containing protein [Lutibacter sp. TH_r2]|uniref:T9SS type A sorting domain-containing protein n=1 Tax=Lutibacter sp. TH_r2 TaxID=3082083 RepID=UPI00295507DE|nr:T9SS type A sorting domain-containing protein [Lutibacter sp. TH_r2]MDV7185865.1 T9SS type A sorting domain-containing protein [Lutibacter sp. TH_r2]